MSLYNMINGFNLACVVFLPMLGRKQDEYPRFRDCFISEDGKYIDIYTRVGGGNRGLGYGEESFRFSVPDEWKDDFQLIVDGNIKMVSDKYVSYVKEFYPKLCKSGLIDQIFR